MKTKTLAIQDRTFELRELTIGKALPIIPRLSGDAAGEAQIELLNACVYENGQSLEVAELPFSMFAELIQAAMDVNGFTSGEE